MKEERIEQRISALIEERKELEKSHAQMVQSFQQQTLKNQSRYQQIQGALTELQQLKNGGNNHDDSIPTPDRGDRAFNVCLSEQPEGR